MHSFPRFLVVSTLLLASVFGPSSAKAGAERIAAAAETSATTPPPPLNYSVAHLAADPVRPCVYATVPDANAVIVIDTISLTVTKTIPIGPLPLGLAISADGKKLWVANSGSTTSAIGVIDLDTLTTLPSLPAPLRPAAVVEGLGHRLYVTPTNTSQPGYSPGMMQINAETGAFEKYFGGQVYTGALLEMSPDRRTLFFGGTGAQHSALIKYDVATSTPTFIQSGTLTGSYAQDLTVSHNGQMLVFPNATGNGTGMGGYRTFEYATSDLHGIYGWFEVGPFPTAAIFSNDDKLLYHGTSSQSAVKIFDADTFALVGTISLGTSPGNTSGVETRDLAVDRSGRWLFVATILYPEGGDLRVFDLGRNDPLPRPALANISTRLNVARGDNVLIGGFIVTGNQTKRLMIRAIGPSLSQLGISGAMENPTIELHNSSGAIIGTNDNWQNTEIGGVIDANQSAEIQNSGLAPSHAAESAMIVTLAPGGYTAVVRGKNDTTGIGVIETYDLDRAADSTLANISTRGFVQTGDDVMIGGTIVTGSASANVLIRAIGPSLMAVGVSNPLPDPILELRDAYGALDSSNDNWRTSQESAIQATGLAPANNAESAILATLAPGAHTAIVRGKDAATGVALVEIYHLTN